MSTTRLITGVCFKKIWGHPEEFLTQRKKERNKTPQENKINKNIKMNLRQHFPLFGFFSVCFSLVGLFWFGKLFMLRRLPTFESNTCFLRDNTACTSNCSWAVSRLIRIALFQIIDSLMRKFPRGYCFNWCRFSRSDNGDVEMHTNRSKRKIQRIY